jgi:hypothetical protein
MPNPGDEYAAGDVPEEMTPGKLRILKRECSAWASIDAAASAWEADRNTVREARAELQNFLDTWDETPEWVRPWLEIDNLRCILREKP